MKAKENLSLRCNFCGHPTPEVHWYKDGTELNDGGKCRIESTPSTTVLDIADVDTVDSGEYSCVVLNAGGKDTCSCHVTVEKKGEV